MPTPTPLHRLAGGRSSLRAAARAAWVPGSRVPKRTFSRTGGAGRLATDYLWAPASSGISRTAGRVKSLRQAARCESYRKLRSTVKDQRIRDTRIQDSASLDPRTPGGGGVPLRPAAHGDRRLGNFYFFSIKLPRSARLPHGVRTSRQDEPKRAILAKLPTVLWHCPMILPVTAATSEWFRRKSNGTGTRAACNVREPRLPTR